MKHRKEQIGDCTLILGDVRDSLALVSDASVQTCVTSPPYWGLRDYNLPPSIWGGDAACKHKWAEHVQPAANGIVHEGGMSGETLSGSSATRKPKRSNFCERCNAWRGQLGLEPTPELFVANLVGIFREVRRVLRDDGTLWLNLGDSYCSTAPGTKAAGPTSRSAKLQQGPRLLMQDAERAKCIRPETPVGLKPKDLVAIPWRVALALQADGWYLRSDIIWAKPNPMPESVTDRPTKAHEYLFLMSKSERYYYDCEAIAERSLTGDERRPYTSEGAWQMDGRPAEQRHGGKPRNPGARAPRNGVDVKGGNQQNGTIPNVEFRNRRSVWTVPVQPCKQAHFATFPPKLIEPCILAGAPWIEGVVLDPFLGSGTTAVVAMRWGRKVIGCEANEEYMALARARVQKLDNEERTSLLTTAAKIEQGELFCE